MILGRNVPMHNIKKKSTVSDAENAKVILNVKMSFFQPVSPSTYVQTTRHLMRKWPCF